MNFYTSLFVAWRFDRQRQTHISSRIREAAVSVHNGHYDRFRLAQTDLDVIMADFHLKLCIEGA